MKEGEEMRVVYIGGIIMETRRKMQHGNIVEPGTESSLPNIEVSCYCGLANSVKKKLCSMCADSPHVSTRVKERSLHSCRKEVMCSVIPKRVHGLLIYRKLVSVTDGSIRKETREYLQYQYCIYSLESADHCSNYMVR